MRKSGLCDNQLSGWTQKKLQSTFQSHTCTKKRSWSLFGGLLPVWFTTAFWIPGKPLHLRSMLSKSTGCTENCSASSLHWSTERAQFFSVTTPNCMLPNQCFRSWTNWATKFGLICHIHLTSRQLTTTSSSILTTFCRENTSTTCRMQKMFSKSLSNIKAQIFMLQEKTNLFLIGRNVLITMVLILINKDIFESSCLLLLLLLFSHQVVSNSSWSHELKYTRLSCPSLSPRVWSSSCPLHWWCHPTISSSVALSSFCPQSFPASGPLPMSQLFTSGGQNIWVSVSASVLPMCIQGWFPLRLTGLIS